MLALTAPPNVSRMLAAGLIEAKRSLHIEGDKLELGLEFRVRVRVNVKIRGN